MQIVYGPSSVSNINNIETVQIRATKLVRNIKLLPYTDRLKYLPTYVIEKLEGDMILVFKILTGIIDPNVACSCNKVSNSITRGNCLKLY